MGIALVQSDQADSTDTTSLDIVFGSNVTAGNLVVVAFYWDENSGEPTVTQTVTPTTLTKVDEQVRGAGNGRVFVYYAANIAGGANTVNISVSPSNLLYGAAHEYSGAATSSPFDQTNKGTGTSTTPSSGSVTPTENDELFFGACATTANTHTAGSGYTIQEAVTVTASTTRLSTEDKISSSADDADWSISNDTWGAIIATFKAAATTIDTGEDPTVTENITPNLLNMPKVFN